MTSDLPSRLRADLSTAMRERDRSRIDVLRTTLAAIANAEAVDLSTIPLGERTSRTEVPRTVLTEEDVRALVVGERDDLRSSADELRRVGRADRATDLDRRADLLDAYL